MKRIFVVRHGDKLKGDFFSSTAGVQDAPLSVEGKRQARITAKRLCRNDIDLIYSSDLLRAIQTSEIIQRCIKAPLKIDPALREINFGIMESKSNEEIEELYPSFSQAYYVQETDIRYPGGESGADVLKRLLPILEQLKSSTSDSIAVITHGGTIRVLLSHILGVDLGKRFLLGDPPALCSVSVIHYDGSIDRLCLHSFNDYSHLARAF